MSDKGGRPTIYSEDLAATILSRMADGEAVAEICRDDDMPARSTVMMWVAQDKNGFMDRYREMMHLRALSWADEITSIADDGLNDWVEMNDKDGNAVGYKLNGEHVQRSKLRVDTRKWLLSKLLPQYADKQIIDQTVQHSGSVTVTKEEAQQISGALDDEC